MFHRSTNNFKVYDIEHVNESMKVYKYKCKYIGLRNLTQYMQSGKQSLYIRYIGQS